MEPENRRWKQGDGNFNGTTTMTGLFTTTTRRHDDTTTGLTAGEHRNAEVDFCGLFLVLAVVEGYKWRAANGCAGLAV